MKLLTPETIGGTDKGSVYVVVAKNDGLTMALKAFLSPHVIHQNPEMAIFVRIRVVTNSPNGSLMLASQSFGIPHFKEKQGGTHVSTEALTSMCMFPCHQNDVHRNLTSSASRLVGEIYKRAAEAGAEIVLDKDSAVDWLTESVKNGLPEYVNEDVNEAVVFAE